PVKVDGVRLINDGGGRFGCVDCRVRRRDHNRESQQAASRQGRRHGRISGAIRKRRFAKSMAMVSCWRRPDPMIPAGSSAISSSLKSLASATNVVESGQVLPPTATLTCLSKKTGANRPRTSRSFSGGGGNLYSSSPSL